MRKNLTAKKTCNSIEKLDVVIRSAELFLEVTFQFTDDLGAFYGSQKSKIKAKTF